MEVKKGQNKASADGQIPPQELEVGPFSGPSLKESGLPNIEFLVHPDQIDTLA